MVEHPLKVEIRRSAARRFISGLIVFHHQRHLQNQSETLGRRLDLEFPASESSLHSARVLSSIVSTRTRNCPRSIQYHSSPCGPKPHIHLEQGSRVSRAQIVHR